MSDPRQERIRELLDEVERLKAQEREPSRRALVAGLVGGAIGAAALATAKPGQAFGDISFSELVKGVAEGIGRTIEGPIKAINALLGTAFSLVVSLSIPTSFQEIIRCLLGPIGAGFNFNACNALRGLISGPSQILRTESIESHMKEIWRRDPTVVMDDMDQMTLDNYEAIYAQVASSQAVTAGLAEAQVQLGEEDTAVLEALNGAAALGSLISVVALHARLTFSTNQRLAMIIQALNAQQQTHGARTIAPAAQERMSVEIRRMQRNPNASVGG